MVFKVCIAKSETQVWSVVLSQTVNRSPTYLSDSIKPGHFRNKFGASQDFWSWKTGKLDCPEGHFVLVRVLWTDGSYTLSPKLNLACVFPCWITFGLQRRCKQILFKVIPLHHNPVRKKKKTISGDYVNRDLLMTHFSLIHLNLKRTIEIVKRKKKKNQLSKNKKMIRTNS